MRHFRRRLRECRLGAFGCCCLGSLAACGHPGDRIYRVYTSGDTTTEVDIYLDGSALLGVWMEPDGRRGYPDARLTPAGLVELEELTQELVDNPPEDDDCAYSRNGISAAVSFPHPTGKVEGVFCYWAGSPGFERSLALLEDVTDALAQCETSAWTRAARDCVPYSEW